MADGRKGNHEGSIYKDKQGHWRALVSLPTFDVKYKRKYIYGKTRKEVSEKMNELNSIAGNVTESLQLVDDSHNHTRMLWDNLVREISSFKV